jgi:hypothetical protein
MSRDSRRFAANHIGDVTRRVRFREALRGSTGRRIFASGFDGRAGARLKKIAFEVSTCSGLPQRFCFSLSLRRGLSMQCEGIIKATARRSHRIFRRGQRAIRGGLVCDRDRRGDGCGFSKIHPEFLISVFVRIRFFSICFRLESRKVAVISFRIHRESFVFRRGIWCGIARRGICGRFAAIVVLKSTHRF